MAVDWTKEDESLNHWTAEFRKVNDRIDDLLGHRIALFAAIALVEDGATQAGLNNCAQAMWSIHLALKSLVIYDATEEYEFMPINYAVRHTGGDAYELTWEAIVAAWADADKLGQLWTVLAIDHMRKASWEQPVTDFSLAQGKP